jgi:hypothetical protein
MQRKEDRVMATSESNTREETGNNETEREEELVIQQKLVCWQLLSTQEKLDR